MFCALTHIWGCGQCTIRRTVCTVIILHHYAILVCCNAFKGIYFTQGVVLSMQENDSTALWCTALHWWCWKLYCTAMWLSALHCNAMQRATMHCIALHCIALLCSTLYWWGWGRTREALLRSSGWLPAIRLPECSTWLTSSQDIFEKYTGNTWEVTKKYTRNI